MIYLLRRPGTLHEGLSNMGDDNDIYSKISPYNYDTELKEKLANTSNFTLPNNCNTISLYVCIANINIGIFLWKHHVNLLLQIKALDPYFGKIPRKFIIVTLGS